MVNSLLAGIHALLVHGRGGLMPESLTRRDYAAHITCGCPASPRNGVRLHFGMLSGFARNRVRHRVGITVRYQSESANPTPTPSSIASCTTPTASISPATACGARDSKAPKE